jgi:hypothetical protein
MKEEGEKVVEIHETKSIEKELPRIVYETKTEQSMTETKYRYIFVVGATIAEALSAFKEVLHEVEEK